MRNLLGARKQLLFQYFLRWPSLPPCAQQQIFMAPAKVFRLIVITRNFSRAKSLCKKNYGLIFVIHINDLANAAIEQLEQKALKV